MKSSFRCVFGLCSAIPMIFLIICYGCITNQSTSNKEITQKRSFHTKKSLINDAIQSYNSKNATIEDMLLSKPDDVIYRYVNLPLDMKYGSNAIPLTVSTLLTNQPVLELGMGMFSTPLLHNIAADQNREIISIDTNFEWLNKFIIYNKTSNHRVYQLTNKELNTFGLDKQWGLVLVDHIFNTKRSKNVINFSNLAQIVVVHDAERAQEGFYQYEKNKIRSKFKYACKFSIFSDRYQREYISTLILSNYVDLSKLKEIFSKVTTDFGHVACDLDY